MMASSKKTELLERNLAQRLRNYQVNPFDGVHIVFVRTHPFLRVGSTAAYKHSTQDGHSAIQGITCV